MGNPAIRTGGQCTKHSCLALEGIKWDQMLKLQSCGHRADVHSHPPIPYSLPSCCLELEGSSARDTCSCRGKLLRSLQKSRVGTGGKGKHTGQSLKSLSHCKGGLDSVCLKDNLCSGASLERWKGSLIGNMARCGGQQRQGPIRSEAGNVFPAGTEAQMYVTPPDIQGQAQRLTKTHTALTRAQTAPASSGSSLTEQGAGPLVATDTVALSQKGTLVLIHSESCQRWTLGLQLPEQPSQEPREGCSFL